MSYIAVIYYRYIDHVPKTKTENAILNIEKNYFQVSNCRLQNKIATLIMNTFLHIIDYCIKTVLYILKLNIIL